MSTVKDPRVFLASCKDYGEAESAVRRIFDASGGAKALLAGRGRVLVKPNLLLPRKPESATTTHPLVVAAVCRVFTEAGASVEVIDSTGAPHTAAMLKRLYSRCGLEETVPPTGALLLTDTASVTLKTEGRTVGSFSCLKAAAEAELVVSVAKAKTHGLAYFTGCAKNMFGCLTGMDKPLYHGKYLSRERFFSAVTDICEAVGPGFCILDGVVGMDGNGPSGGSPCPWGVILGGVNPHTVDLAACSLISLRAERVPMLVQAQKRGLIPASASELQWLGDEREANCKSFRPPGTERGFVFLISKLLPRRLRRKVREKGAKYPVVSSRCIGCGDCVRVCPKRAIAFSGRVASVNTDSCIKCYCCHEFCPVGAIDYAKKR
ncbi:MAG: DUF362 domain-containing protein [Oscillospiraceae bacterium]|nr:DUF362 domain-containing protein [Oscillospiraceae bacterium]